ncbi:type I-E CRISPR-associated protein Cas7/Cse4/CasC [Haloglycomyces albus]|uniref:type I-E CRISPR-associated protein Cas7/Cse4/CasC n=1 Tax=Haloglycomyces albus TaxID=526067 RepID=UPI00046CBB5F|nr:type I-E CRISPR-associated protein Cas7/Cse4/CasC [Haloglycomyces albus]
MSQRLFADVSIIQSLPPSNVNRDDSGSPKHAEFGGVKRGRIASQSQKRHARIHFASHLPELDRATRTSRIQQLLDERLAEHADDDTARRLAVAAVDSFGIDRNKNNDENLSYMLFCGYRQVDAMADTIIGELDELSGMEKAALDKRMKKLNLLGSLESGNPAEVALFGRMVANVTDLNVDAAVQVAHAVSTHRIHNKFDYFTAVDDENRDNSGAAMIGNIEFNSATYYRYATVGIHQLLNNLGDKDLTAMTATEFVRSFALSLPTGNQNGFAHHTRPHAVVVALRSDQPVNLVNAFEDPLKPHSERGFASRSVIQLAQEMKQTTDIWGEAPGAVLATYATGKDETIVSEQFGPSVPFPELTGSLHTKIAEWLESGDLK